jgi:hypothetical protein
MDCFHLTRREQANPVQFLVGEVRLFLVAGALYVAQSRFLRDTAELRFWYAEQEGSSCLRDIFRDLIVHTFPLCCRDSRDASKARVIVLKMPVLDALSIYMNLHPHEFGPPPSQSRG